MKKGSFFKSLPFKLLVAVILGILSGLVLNRYSTNGISMAVLNIVVTVKYILGQIITFCVPLIVLGFIAPSITKLGKNASVMLGVAVVLAYGSSIGAALFSTASGFFIIPHLSIHSYAAGLKQLPEVIFELEIPQIMSVMSALVFSVMIGLAATWTKAKLVTGLLDEFQKIVLALVSRIIIPILPLFIGSTFCGLAYEGTITRQLPVFLEIIVLVLAGHFIWMAFLYILAGIYSGENPLEVVRHYAPAYLTAVGTMLSAAQSLYWSNQNACSACSAAADRFSSESLQAVSAGFPEGHLSGHSHHCPVLQALGDMSDLVYIRFRKSNHHCMGHYCRRQICCLNIHLMQP